MKKMALILAVASLAVIGMQSCKKEENHKPPIKQNIDIQLTANQSYNFSLPKNKRDDAYEITSPASHATISEVGKDASGNRIYSYTPTLNYYGTDRVVVANVEEGDRPQGGGNCGSNPPPPKHGKGDCDGGEEDHYIVTINFNVANATRDSK